MRRTLRTRLPTRWPVAAALGALAAGFSARHAGALQFITPQEALPAANYRFSSPGGGTAYTNPTPNTDPSFVGLGYDFSPVGGSGWGGSGRIMDVTMVTPITAYSANHFPPAIGLNLLFFDSITSTRRTAVEFSHTGAGGDILLNTMTQAFADSDHISVMRVLDVSSQNYTGMPAFMIGTTAGSGTEQVATTHIGSVFNTGGVDKYELSTNSTGTDTFSYWESGDSGSPMMIMYKGQLTIAGAAHYANGQGSTLLSVPGFDPITPSDAIIAPTGYALRFTIYDVPADTANTANVWNGTVDGSFANPANWAKNVVPQNLPVVFDSSSTGGNTAIDLGGSQSLRGLLFRAVSGSPSGFTFAAGNTLTIGHDGIRNEDSSTQTFNGPIVIGGVQNWEAVNGDLVFNGPINLQGNLLVIQGAQDTTVNGVVSGSANLAKDDPGTLTINTPVANTGGITFLHDGTLRLGGSNILPASSILRFDAANPALLDLQGNNQTLGDLRSAMSGLGQVKLGGGTLTIGGDNFATGYAGTFLGLGNVVKTGLGTFTLTADNSAFPGNLLVNGGVLQLSTGTLNGTGSGQVMINAGGKMIGSGTAGNIVLNSGGVLAPGAGISGSLTASSLTWNGGGDVFMALGTPGTSALLNLSTGTLTKGTPGNYEFTFANAGGLAVGIYTLAQVPANTNFVATDFGYTNGNGFSGVFLMSGGLLKFQVLNAGNPPVQGGWINFNSLAFLNAPGVTGTAIYETGTNWLNGAVTNVFTSGVQGGFNQVVLFQKSETLAGGMTVNFNTIDPAPAISPGTSGWFFTSQSTVATLTLGGDFTANNAFEKVSPLAPSLAPGPGIGTTVVLGVKNSAIPNSGATLAAIELGGTARTFTTNIPGDATNADFGVFLGAPITDASASGAKVTKAGPGNLILGSANTFAGPLDVQGGILSLVDLGTIASPTVTIENGAEIFLGNNSRDINNTNRNIINSRFTASGGANVTLSGGTITFAAGNGTSSTGTGGTVPTGYTGAGGNPESQAFGTVTAARGLEIFQSVTTGSTTSGSFGDDATISINALNRLAGATLFLPGLTTGPVGINGNYVKVTSLNGAPPPAGVLPYAYTGSGSSGFTFTGFALYDPTNGFQPSTAATNSNYVTAATFAGGTATSDFQLTGNVATTTSQALNSLILNASVTLTSSGGPQTLTLNSGGLLFLGNGTIGSTTAASNVPIDFNQLEAVVGVSANGIANLLGPLVHANGLTVTTSPINSSLWLNFANPFNSDSTKTQNNWGATNINAGRLVIQNPAALPNTGNVTVNISTSTANPSSAAIVAIPAVLDLDGNNVTIGPLNGGGVVSLISSITGRFPTGTVNGTFTVGNGDGSGSFAGELQNSLLPVLYYGAAQGNQLTVYGTTGSLPTLGLTKTGLGTETLSGLNTYTGPTNVLGGTLALSGAGTLGMNSAVSLADGVTLDLSASTVSPAVGSLAGTAASTIALGPAIFTVGGNDAITATSSKITGTGGLLKTGAGMLTLFGQNAATGSFTASQGVLRFDSTLTNAPAFALTSPLVVAGGTAQAIGSYTLALTDSAAGLTVKPGASLLQFFGQSGKSLKVTLGAIARSAGGTVDFALANAQATTTSGTSGSLLGGWATFNGMSDWAANLAGSVVAGASSGKETLSANPATWPSGKDVNNGTTGFNGTAVAGSNINSLLFKAAHSSAITLAGTLTITNGGILETAAVGANASTISGGTLVSGNGQDLIVIQNNPAAPLTISSALLGQAGLTKSGAGQLIISGADQHYGLTSVNAGTLTVTGTATLGANSPLAISPRATVDLTASSAAQTFASLNGGGMLFVGAAGLSFGSDDSASTFTGTIDGVGGLTKSGAGTFTLSGATAWSGPLVVNGGKVAVLGTGTLGHNSAVTLNSVNGAPTVLDLSGATSAITLGSLSGSGALYLSPAGVTIGTDGTSTIFGGNIAGVGGFTKVGGGTLTLTGTNLSVPDTQYNIVANGGEYVVGSTLALDFTTSATTKLQTGGALTVGGGSIAALGNPNVAFTQADGSFLVNPGASSLSASVPAGASANFVLKLNTISRVAGGTVDVNPNPAGAATALITASNALTNGLIGGYVTVNHLSDWAWSLSDGSLRPLQNAASANVTASVSNTYTGTTFTSSAEIFSLSSTAGLAVGQGVIGTGIPAGTTITAIFSNAVLISATPTSAVTGVSFIFDGLTVSSTQGLVVGDPVTGTNVPANAFISAIVGNTVSLSTFPAGTGTISAISIPGYTFGTTNDQGATIATMSDAGNWTTANYGANLAKANLTDDSLGFTGTLQASTTINSLRMNTATSSFLTLASAATLTLASGGLLETAAVGPNALGIGGTGKITSGNGADLIVLQNNPAAPLTISAGITGSIGLTKSGAGQLTLNGTNTYTGATTLGAGTLVLMGPATLGSNSAVSVLPGTILDLTVSLLAHIFGSLSSQSAGMGTGGGLIMLGGTNLTVGGNNTSTIFGGEIEGSAGLIKNGVGVFTLAGANTYTGLTSINAGALELAPGGSIFGSVNVGNGTGAATLEGGGSVGDVLVDGTSATKFGLLYAGTPAGGGYTLATPGMLTTGDLDFAGAFSQVAFLLGAPDDAGLTYSSIEVQGDLSLNGAVLDLTALSGFGPGTYELFRYTGSETGALSFATTLPAGYQPSQLSLSYGGGSVTLTVSPLAVPEPATPLLLASGLVLLASRRRRAK